MKVYHITGGMMPESYMYSNWFEAMDGDPDKIRISDPTPDGGSLIMPTSLNAGRPILPDFVPTKLRRRGPGIKQQPLLDVNSWRYGTLLVPQVFKDILEELEPGVHQFFPMEYYQKDEKIGEGYWFIFGQRLDTLHDTACEPGRDERGFLITSGPDGKRVKSRAVLSAKKIDGAHAWVDKFLGGGARLISGEFGDRLKAQNLTGITYDLVSVE